MKKSENAIRIYLVLFIKIFATLAILDSHLCRIFDSAIFIPFSSIAVFYTFALAYDPNYVVYASVINEVAIIFLVLALLTTLIGIVYRGARKISVFFIVFSVFVDFVISFFVGDITLKISCIVVSASMLVMCLCSLKKH